MLKIYYYIEFFDIDEYVRRMDMLTAEQIQAILPHRYPFLMVDRILEVEEGKRAVGIKNVQLMKTFSMDIFRVIQSCQASSLSKHLLK